jgi:2-polyprenyl-3-methyl-5-hydroxy-6-metoxy-1,4-benzoquinol methylase
MKGLDEFEGCPLCGSTSLLPLEAYRENYLVRCGRCHFVFCRRKPSAEELQDHYLGYPRASSISPITLKRYEELLDTLEKYRSTNKLIDVGCGDGYFLEAARKRNWDVYGTEFTEEAVGICERKGIQMSLGPLNPAHYEKESFDVITSFEVIEHINQPQREVGAFFSILRKGGIVYVTTPNFNSISRNIIGKNWSIIEYPEHLSYYTRPTLRRVFVENQFQLLAMTTTGFSINRMMWTRSISSTVLDKDEDLRQKIDQHAVFRIMKLVINLMLNVVGKGDAIKAYFQKE